MKRRGHLVLILPFITSFLMRCTTDAPRLEKEISSQAIVSEKSSKDFSLLSDSAHLTIDEYIAWYPSHAGLLGLNSDTLGYSYHVTFVPNEIEAIGLAKSLQLPYSAIDSLLSIKEPYLYFTLTIHPHGPSQVQSLKEALLSPYSNLDIQKDFSLIAGKDTLPCVVFQPLKGNGRNEGLTYQIAFEKSGQLENLTFSYQDRLLGAGKRDFKFKNIQALPHLKIESSKG